MGRGHGLFQVLLGTWVLLACSVEVAAIGILLSGHPNLLLYNIYWVIEFGALLAIAQSLHPLPRPVAWSIGAAFVLVWCGNMLLIDAKVQMVHISVIVGALVLVGIYLHQLWVIADQRTEPMWQLPETWLCMAVLVYYGASAPLQGSMNFFLLRDMSLAMTLSSIGHVFFFAKLALMGIACLKARTHDPLHERPN